MGTVEGLIAFWNSVSYTSGRFPPVELASEGATLFLFFRGIIGTDAEYGGTLGGRFSSWGGRCEAGLGLKERG